MTQLTEAQMADCRKANAAFSQTVAGNREEFAQHMYAAGLAANQRETETAKQQYDRLMQGENEPDPVERLRVEPFLLDVSDAIPINYPAPSATEAAKVDGARIWAILSEDDSSDETKLLRISVIVHDSLGGGNV